MADITSLFSIKEEIIGNNLSDAEEERFEWNVYMNKFYLLYCR